MALKVRTTRDGTFKTALNEAGWLEEEVLAAGHLRQAGSSSQLGLALPLLRPRRSKKLPRHFLLAATASEVVAFKVTEVGGQAGTAYEKLKILDGVAARYPRESVSLTDLPDREKSKGGTITIEGESFPVMRPNRYGDTNTDELIGLLSGQAAGARVDA